MNKTTEDILVRLKRRKLEEAEQEKDLNHVENERDFVFELFILGSICILGVRLIFINIDWVWICIIPFAYHSLALIVSNTAFSVRLFSVIRYESVIHEFDP